MLHHNKNPARTNVYRIPVWGKLLEIQKKTPKTPATGTEWIKTLTNNNFRCVNFSAK
jgi:hypothetical protein